MLCWLTNFFASKDEGQTWNLVSTLPDRHYDAIGLILTERAFYAAFDIGIFRSEDNGKNVEGNKRWR